VTVDTVVVATATDDGDTPITAFCKSQGIAYFRLRNFTAGQDYSGIRLTGDEPDDVDLIGRIVARMDRPHWECGLDEIISIYRQFVK